MHPKVLTWGRRGRRRVRVVWQGAQSRLLGRGEVVVELGAPRRWQRWRRLGAPRRWRRWRLQQRRRRWRRRRRGSLAKSRETSPPVIDSCREASPDGEAEGHSDHRSQSGCSPRSLVEEGRRNGIIGAPGEMGDEIDALRVDGAARADRDDDEAHIGPDVAILVAPRVSSDGKVGRHAPARSVWWAAMWAAPAASRVLMSMRTKELGLS